MASLSLKQLTLKTVALIALTSSNRGQSIHLADISKMTVTKDYVTFIINNRIKTTKRVLKPTYIKCPSSSIEELDVAKYVAHYIETTKALREKTSTKLFISWKTNREISRVTIARWLKEMLTLAGIDTSIFKSHSYRGAGLSAAYEKGASLNQIMAQGDWKGVNTFHKFYNAPPANSSLGRLILEDQQVDLLGKNNFD